MELNAARLCSRNPDEWSSLLIAVALWGGPWALAGMDSVAFNASNMES